MKASGNDVTAAVTASASARSRAKQLARGAGDGKAFAGLPGSLDYLREEAQLQTTRREFKQGGRGRRAFLMDDMQSASQEGQANAAALKQALKPYRQETRKELLAEAVAVGLETRTQTQQLVRAASIVIVATEFGRTAHINGIGGTDHGTGGSMFLVGGALHGGRVAGHWLGIGSGELYQGRDVHATTDFRSVFKGVLAAHPGVAESLLESRVFPGSQSVEPLGNLVTSVRAAA